MEAAARDGSLRPGGTIVECTSGDTGVGPVRLSVGCEDLEDLWLDVEQALAAVWSAQMGKFLGAAPPDPANVALDGRPQVS